MADIEQLSLQTLYEKINNKADKNHTHTFMGSIDSALTLRGIPAENFVRNDLKSQIIKSYGDLTNLSVSSNNTSISLKARDNRASLEVDSPSLLMSSLTMSGANNGDLSVNILGQLLINNSRVLTINDKNELTGVDFSDLEVSGRGILVDSQEPETIEDGMIWGQVIDSDVALDDTAEANHNLYTTPVGSIIKTLSTTVPNGFIKADGRSVARAVYSPLWKFVKTQAPLTSDTNWKKMYQANKHVSMYSSGDGVSSFRVPNLVSEDDTMYIIKAYDELSVKDTINLSALEDTIIQLQESAATSGVGYIKYPDGALIQYGTAIGTQCNFSISFINNQYAMITNYSGKIKDINNVSVLTKNTNKCTFAVYGSGNKILTTAVVDYIAIGRWKA